MKIKIEKEIPDEQVIGNSNNVDFGVNPADEQDAIDSAIGIQADSMSLPQGEIAQEPILDEMGNPTAGFSRDPATDYAGMLGAGQPKPQGYVGKNGMVVPKQQSPGVQPQAQAAPSPKYVQATPRAVDETIPMGGEQTNFAQQNLQSKKAQAMALHQRKTAEKQLGQANAIEKLNEAQAYSDLAKSYDGQIQEHEQMINDIDNKEALRSSRIIDRLDSFKDIELPKDNKVLTAIAVFMGGVGLGPGDTNQVLKFIQDRYENNLKAMLVNSKQRADLLEQLKQVDPSIVRSKAGLVNALNALKDKQAVAASREALMKAKSPSQVAKAKQLAAVAQQEYEKSIAAMDQALDKNNETQRKYEEGKGTSTGKYQVVEQSKVKLPADRKRLIPTTNGKAYLVPESQDVKKVQEYMVETKKMLSNLKKLGAYLAKPFSQRASDKLRNSKKWGEMQNVIGEISAAGRRIDNMGVPQKFEMEVIAQKYGLNPDALFSQKPQGAVQNTIKTIMQNHRVNLEYFNIDPNDPYMY